MLVTLQNDGTPVPRRRNQNFVGCDFADDPATDTTTIAPGARLWWSPVDFAILNRGAYSVYAPGDSLVVPPHGGLVLASGNVTTMAAFCTTKPLTVYGVRFAWPFASVSRNIRASLVKYVTVDESPSYEIELAAKTIAVVGSASTAVSVYFDAPCVLGSAGVNRILSVRVHEASESVYTYFLWNSAETGFAPTQIAAPEMVNRTTPFIGGEGIVWVNFSGSTGSSLVASPPDGDFHPIEPILTPP